MHCHTNWSVQMNFQLCKDYHLEWTNITLGGESYQKDKEALSELLSD